MKVNGTEVCKFLSGATFAGAMANGYLYLTGTSVPFLGDTITPEFLGMRAWVLFVLFLVFFSFGYLKR